MVYSHFLSGFLCFALFASSVSSFGQNENDAEATIASSRSSQQGQRQTQQTVISYDCAFTEPLYLEGWGEEGLEVYMEHYANYFTEQVTFRLTYNDWSWLGIGINLDGGHAMTNSYAVIGSIDDGVQFYWMMNELEDGSGLWKLDDVHNQITNKKFEQTPDGYTIMEFTMNMEIVDEDPNATPYHYINEESAYIWGAGLPNNEWLGIHTTLGFFSGLSPYDGCDEVVTVVTEAPTPTVVPPVDEEGNGGIDDGEVVEQLDGADVGDEQQGQESNIFNSDEEEDDNSTTPVTTTTGSGPTLSGSGPTRPSASNAGSVSLNMGTSRASDETRTLWVTHGILLGLAWGIFVPLAIGASYLKNNVRFLQNKAMWLTLHFYMSMFAVLLTLLGFIIGVVAANKEAEPTHFTKDTHHKVGLTIFLLVFVQGFLGYFRPSPTTKDTTKPTKDDDESSEDVDHTLSFHVDGEDVVVDDDKKEKKQTEMKKDTSKDKNDNTYKPFLRQYWEYFHRSLGMTLFGLAWYNCHSGIQLLASKYIQDDEERLLTLFWSIAGFIACSIFFVGYVIRPAIEYRC